ISDCVVLLGTNNLHGLSTEEIESKLAALYDRLRPFCRIWAATLLPRDADPPDMMAKRAAVNNWIRRTASVAAVIDFQAAVTSPGEPNHFRSGLGEDGIHPSIEGYRVIGTEAARALAAPKVDGVSPGSGDSGGGATVVVSGASFKPGAAVLFGSVPAASVEVVSSTSLRATTPAHAAGRVDVSVRNRDGLSFTLAQGFQYEGGSSPYDPQSPSSSGKSS